MSKIYVIADLHLRHEKVIQFEQIPRPFSTIQEHDEAIIARWNSVVTKRDTVYVLGDVAFKREGLELVGRLLGTKHLVLGNHDLRPSVEYLAYFNRLYGSVIVQGCLLTHIPVHTSQFRSCKLNVHGHLHSESLQDRRYVCVSAEQIGLKPVLLEDVIRERLR